MNWKYECYLESYLTRPEDDWVHQKGRVIELKNKRISAHKFKGQDAFFFKIKQLVPGMRKIHIHQYKISTETAQAMCQLANLLNMDYREEVSGE